MFDQVTTVNEGSTENWEDLSQVKKGNSYKSSKNLSEFMQ